MWKWKRWLWPKLRSSEILFPWLNVTTVKSHLVYAFRKVTRSWDESFPVWGPPGERALMFSSSLNRSRFFLDPQNCLICSPKLNFAKCTCFRLCLPNGIKSLIHVTHPPPPPPSYFVKTGIDFQTSVQSQANYDILTHCDKTEKSEEMSSDKVLIIKLYAWNILPSYKNQCFPVPWKTKLTFSTESKWSCFLGHPSYTW